MVSNQTWRTLYCLAPGSALNAQVTAAANLIDMTFVKFFGYASTEQNILSIDINTGLVKHSHHA